MTVNEIYNLIGSNIVSGIDEPWVNAVLNIESYIDDYAQFQGKYINLTNEKKNINVRNFSLKELRTGIFELLKIMTENNENRWNKAIFKIWSNNKFEMEFIWDQDLDDKIKANS